MQENVQSEEKEEVVRRRHKIPKTLVPTLKQAYLEGKGSIRKLSELYNVSYGALAAHCTKGNWSGTSTKIVEKVMEKVEKMEVSRLERLHSHEDRMISRMEKRLISVDKSLDQVGDLVPPDELKQIVSTESTIDQVIRRSLGANDNKVEHTGSVELNIVSVLQRLRERRPEGGEPSTIDVETLRLMGQNLTD